MGRRAWIVSGFWILYAIVLACDGQYAWAHTSVVLAAAAALGLSIGFYILDVVRQNHAPGRFRAYPLWFRRILHDA
ncbi:MAG TPA: hypothetical protein VGC88_04600 [Terriglobales bacterium]|jgi:hypothetical protein